MKRPRRPLLALSAALAGALGPAVAPAGAAEGAALPMPPAEQAVAVAAPPAAAGRAAAASPPARAASRLRAHLARAMRAAGRRSGAYVGDLTARRLLFRRRAGTPRVLASIAKLFTTAAALDGFGAEGALSTAVLGAGAVDPGGVWRGDLYLRGGGDPTFGSADFAARAYGGGATVEALADAVADAGMTEVSGRVLGDESRFDSLRGGPASAYRVSGYVAPLSALSFDRGLANTRGSAFQASPPAFAAGRLTAALEERGVEVRGAAGEGVAPYSATELAAVASPPMARLVEITNKRSDNFFAEVLAKGVGARAAGIGSTAAGARAATRLAARLGVSAQLADGSGLSWANRASPAGVARLLARLREDGATFPAFRASLPVAGRDGTLRDRMRSGPARGRCRAKTGTLSNVSALSGYCTSRAGRTIVFSFLMNGVNPVGARRLQDRMAQALAAYPG